MQRIFTCSIVFIIFLNQASATNYYLSTSDPLANDSNAVSTAATPWKSFANLNALPAFVSGDTIFLKSGDVFRGLLDINVANNLVITSYGTGAKPVINGSELVSSWMQAAGLYYANFTGPVINFFVNNREQIPARYPDEGNYLTVDTATDTFLEDAALTGIPDSILNNSQICVHTAQWCWEKSPISSSNGNQVYFTNATLRIPTSGYGYFLYDDLSYLTSGNEWKYDSATYIIYYMPVSGHPDSMLCEASVHSYGILLGNSATNITISNIAFEKQGEAGISIPNSTNENIKIVNCYFMGQYKFGIDLRGRNVEVSSNYFREVDGIAVFINGNGFKANVHHNTFRNNGGFRNSGIGQEINLTAIKGAFVDSCTIHHNDIDSSGYCGISMDGRWNIIERNIVKNVMLLNNDGAALKSFGTASQYTVFRNNFVSYSNGNTEGTPNGPHFITPAIYFDFSTNNCTIEENTIFDQSAKGIFLNSGTNNNTITRNVIYRCSHGLDFNGGPIIPTQMTGMSITGNTIFAGGVADYIIRMVDNTGGFNHGTIDSNYYFQPYDESKYALFPTGPNSHDDYTFTDWQDSTGYDAFSKSSFFMYPSAVFSDTIFMNPTDSIVTINLGTTKYLDLDSNEVCADITLQPYTSRILIRSTSNCTTSITEKFDENSFSVYPNPAGSLICINSKQNMESVNIFDMTGKLLYEIQKTGQTFLELLLNLSEGIYFIRVSTESGQMTKKLTVAW